MLEPWATPRLAELRRPLLPMPLARRAGHLVELPVEHRQLVRPGAVVAVALEPQAQRKLEDVGLVDERADEAGGSGAIARQLLERLERPAQVWPHERPAQPPAVLRVEIGGRDDVAAHVLRLWTGVAVGRRGDDVDPRPPHDRRIGGRGLPQAPREALEAAGLAVQGR